MSEAWRVLGRRYDWKTSEAADEVVATYLSREQADADAALRPLVRGIVEYVVEPELPEVSARADIVRILPLSVLVKAILGPHEAHGGRKPTRCVASPVQISKWSEDCALIQTPLVKWAHGIERGVEGSLRIMNVPVVLGFKDALPELQWVEKVEG